MEFNLKNLKGLLALLKSAPRITIVLGKRNLVKPLSYLIMPKEDDFSEVSNKIRATLIGFNPDASLKPTSLRNISPWVYHLWHITSYDRFLQLCIKSGDNPFHMPIRGLSDRVQSEWIGSLKMPDVSIQDALNVHFRQKLQNHRLNLFRPWGDNELIIQGYLSEAKIPSDDRMWHVGDRLYPGQDSRLVLTVKAASFPLFKKLGAKNIVYSEWRQHYTLKIPHDRWYLDECLKFAKKRWKLWKDLDETIKWVDKSMRVLASFKNNSKEVKEIGEIIT